LKRIAFNSLLARRHNRPRRKPCLIAAKHGLFGLFDLLAVARASLDIPGIGVMRAPGSATHEQRGVETPD
jgi:hypothetical protein